MLIWPVRRPIDGGGLSGLACRSPGPARSGLERSEFDLPNAIENALILVRERASRRGIRLGHTIDERLGAIGGDERKVKQVLLNLLSNALKFTPEGFIDVGDRRTEGFEKR